MAAVLVDDVAVDGAAVVDAPMVAATEGARVSADPLGLDDYFVLEHL